MKFPWQLKLMEGGALDAEPVEVSKEEQILAVHDQDFNPIPGAEPPKEPPKEPDLNPDLNPPVDEPLPAEPKPVDEGEVVDELDVLKKYELDSRYDNVDAVIEDFKGSRAKTEQLAQAMKDAGYQTSDDPVQDLLDVMEAEQASRQPGFLTGAQPPAEVATGPSAGSGVAAPGQEPPPAPPRPGEKTFGFVTKYHEQLKWTPEFIAEMAGALAEHLPQPKAPEAPTPSVSREDMAALAKITNALLRDQMIQEHISDRQTRGEKLPRGYRQRLIDEVEKNPRIMERAWNGYILRRRSNGVMDDYASGILAERDPATGLSRAEADNAAAEQARVAADRRTVRGGEVPAAAGKPRVPSDRDLEHQIEEMGRKIL